MRGRVGVVAALVLLALSACTSDGDDPDPARSTQASVAASGTPAVEKPVKPEQEPTRQSAEAFVEYFWETYNYGYDSGDPSLMEEISQRECRTCISFVSNMKSVSAANTRVVGSQVSVLGSVTPDYKIISGIGVVSKIRQAPGTSTNRSGQVTQLRGYKSIDSTIALDWTGSAWAVAGVSNDLKTQVDW